MSIVLGLFDTPTYNVLNELGIPAKEVIVKKMCSNETYSKVRIDQYLFDNFPILSGLEQEDAI
jgi:hypothetical protein